MIRSAAHTFEQQFYEATLARLPEEAQAALEALLATEIAEASARDADGGTEGEQAGLAPNAPQATAASTTVTLHHLRMDPGRVGLATMLEEMAKLRRIRELKLPDDVFPGMARKVLAVYRNRASVEEPSRLRAHSKAKRLTYLSALCVMRAQEITDGLVDLLIRIVHKIDVRAEKRVEQEYLNEFKRVANKEGILYRIAEAAVGRPDGKVAEVVFPVASEKLLREVIKEYKAKSPAFRKQVHLIMRASYSHHYRRMVPELLDILDFQSNNELYRPVIRAIQLVKDYVRSPRQYYPDHEIIPIKEVVAAKWREFVVEQDDDGTEKVNRLNYEVCMLQALREKVRVREIWIEGANHYRDYVEYTKGTKSGLVHPPQRTGVQVHAQQCHVLSRIQCGTVPARASLPRPPGRALSPLAESPLASSQPGTCSESHAATCPCSFQEIAGQTAFGHTSAPASARP